MNVRAKNISPLRVPLMSDRPPFARACALGAAPPHLGCAGEIFFAPTCANDIHSPNHQPSPHPKSWRTANLTTHHGCTGEKYFARTCAIDAQSPTRCDRAPAVRRRTMDVGAKHFSPGLAPSVRNRPTIKHRHSINRGARRNLPPHHGCTGEIFFARACAIDAPSITHRWPARHIAG